MENDIKKQQAAKMVGKLYETEKYSSSKRGEIINLTTKIENTLTDIFACIFCQGKYSSDIEANKLLDKERIELKSLILGKIDFRDKIESLKNIILVKKPEILETNAPLINALVKDLDKAREFRNIIAHSELDILSREFIKELKQNVDNKIDRFQIIEYKKGKAIPHLISEERINTEINTMQRVLFKLQKLHALIQGDIDLADDIEYFSHLANS